MEDPGLTYRTTPALGNGSRPISGMTHYLIKRYRVRNRGIVILHRIARNAVALPLHGTSPSHMPALLKPWRATLTMG